MKTIIAFIFLFLSASTFATPMGYYIYLKNSIPTIEKNYQRMSCKKKIIAAMDESMIETIMFMQTESEHNKKPIFCIPKDTKLDADTIKKVMLHEYEANSLPEDQKVSMPAAAFAIIGLHRKYHC